MIFLSACNSQNTENKTDNFNSSEFTKTSNPENINIEKIESIFEKTNLVWKEHHDKNHNFKLQYPTEVNHQNLQINIDVLDKKIVENNEFNSLQNFNKEEKVIDNRKVQIYRLIPVGETLFDQAYIFLPEYDKYLKIGSRVCFNFENKNVCPDKEQEWKNEIFTKMMNSLKFIESEKIDTSNWKVYKNDEFNFLLKFPNSWGNFEGRKRMSKIHLGVFGFGFTDQEEMNNGHKKDLFTIYIFSQEAWKEIGTWGEEYQTIKLSENNDFIVSYVISNEEDVNNNFQEKLKDVQSILKTFELIESSNKSDISKESDLIEIKENNTIILETPVKSNTDKINNNLDKISQETPYKELIEYKKWNLTKIPDGNNFEFTNKKQEIINISYKGAPYLGSNTTLKINDITIIDTSDCLKYGGPDPSIPEYEPIFARAKCEKYYEGVNFNGKDIEHDFKNSMAGIWISKNEPKIAIYGGKMIINFEKSDYKINEDYLDLEKEGYILLRAVY